MMLNELAKEIYKNAADKGFHNSAGNVGERLMLIVSELSEALEAHRKNKFCKVNMSVINGWVNDEDFIPHFKQGVKDTLEDEMADALIRILDFAAEFDIDIEAHIKAKMRFNSTREYKHGKSY